MEVKKGSLIVALLVLTSAFFATLTTIPESAEATTLYVGGVGPGNYTTIQNAINAATPGDTIFVYNGAYTGGVSINKPLSLIGEDRNTTLIEGGGFGNVVLVTADWVNITGFTMSNGESDGIKLSYVRDSHIADNILSSNKQGGIHLYYSSNIVLSGNSMVGNGILVRGYSSEQWDTHVIEATNTVNGKPVRYWKNVAGGTIPSGAGQIILASCSGVNIENQNVSDGSSGIQLGFSSSSTIINNNASGNYVGISIWHSTNIKVSGNTASWNEAFGAYLKHSHDNTLSDNILLDNNYGISLENSDDNTIENNTISGSLAGISLYASVSIVAFDNTMVGNGIVMWASLPIMAVEQWNTHTIDISNTVNGKPVYYWKDVVGGSIPSGAGEVILANCSNVLVENQNVSNSTVGIELGFSSNNTVIGNIANSNFIGIFAYQSHNNAIAENTVSSNEDGGIYLVYSHINVISGNSLSSNNEYGISVAFSGYNTISGNTISSNNLHGIYLSYSRVNRIASNFISSNNEHGIYVYLSGNSTLVNNAISSNKMDGIRLWASSYDIIGNNTISYNQEGITIVNGNSGIVIDNCVAYNKGYGIFLDSTLGTIVARNIIDSNNRTGVYVYSFGDNRVYHNTFVNNQDQAYDATTNIWDNGYPSGGNHWSDYTGSDVMRGPNQDQPGSDGIGDTPYVIDADSQDRYPLTTPVVAYPRPPNVLDASLSGNNLENVTLKWTLSPDDEIGLGLVVSYDIYRNVTYNRQGLAYQLIASRPIGTSEFIDVSVGEGNPDNYFYFVCAIDMNSNTSCSENQAGKFTRSLTEGPNLVSIPLVQSNESVENVFQTVEFNEIWTYHSQDTSYPWKWFMASKPYKGDLRTANHRKGVWINVTGDCNLTVAGVVPTSTTIDLQAGWNLVGFPSFDGNHTVAALKAAIAVERIEGYDAPAPPYSLRVMADGDFLLAGFGYWIRVESGSVWVVGNQ